MTATTEPTNVPALTTVSPSIFTFIASDKDLSGSGNIEIYKIRANSTFILTSILLECVYMGGVIGVTVNCSISTANSVIARMIAPQSVAEGANMISLSYPIPLKFTDKIDDHFILTNTAASIYSRATIIGYYL